PSPTTPAPTTASAATSTAPRSKRRWRAPWRVSEGQSQAASGAKLPRARLRAPRRAQAARAITMAIVAAAKPPGIVGGEEDAGRAFSTCTGAGLLAGAAGSSILGATASPTEPVSVAALGRVAAAGTGTVEGTGDTARAGWEAALRVVVEAGAAAGFAGCDE